MERCHGVPGPVTGELPSGATLRGTYSEDSSTAGGVATPVSFGLRLASAPTVHVVPLGGPKPAECQGTVYVPEASPGHLCIYRHREVGFGVPQVLALAKPDKPDLATVDTGKSGVVGALLSFTSSGSSNYAQGTWAVTAP